MTTPARLEVAQPFRKLSAMPNARIPALLMLTFLLFAAVIA